MSVTSCKNIYLVLSLSGFLNTGILCLCFMNDYEEKCLTKLVCMCG